MWQTPLTPTHYKQQHRHEEAMQGYHTNHLCPHPEADINRFNTGTGGILCYFKMYTLARSTLIIHIH